MKNTALIALLGLMLVASSQAAPSQANDGDVILAFSSSGTQNPGINYMVNLGSRVDFTSNFNSMLTDIRTDLTSIYGYDSVYNNGEVRFGGVSADTTTSILYATVAAGTTGWTPEAVKSETAQSFAASKIAGMYINYNRYVSQATPGTVGLSGVRVDVSDEGSWTDYHDNLQSGLPFDFFFGSLEGNLTDGVTFYNMDWNNGRNSDPVSVTTLSGVPEPSTYVLFGLGALLLIIAYRRRSNA
jgi:hypothetical protein